jgi:hypothetical protein
MADQLSADAIQKIQNDYFIQFMLNTSNMLEEINHKLHCEVPVAKEKEINGQMVIDIVWENKFNLKPMISEWGINQVMNKLNTLLSVPTATGNISELQVAQLSYQAYSDIITIFSLNYDKCGFESEAIMDSLSHDIVAIVFTHLSKSKEGTFVRQMQSSYSYSEIRDGKTGKEAKQSNISV